jgi:preprotein translocase subunit SecY
MFKTLINAFKVQDIRKRLLYTFFILVVVRLGSLITVPGISADTIREYMSSALGDSLNIFSSFTGGSFEQMSIFALSVTPYITASIIIQLLTIAIPALEEMHKDGEEGRKKITAITRFMTVGLAILESAGLAVGFGNKGVIENYNFWTVFCIVVILTAGSAIIMWLGERVTERGVGNGISIILLINIVSTMPNDFKNLYTQFMKGKDPVRLVLVGLLIVAIVVVTVVLVCALQGAERKIPVQYAKSVRGRKTMGGQTSHIPLKVNTAGVIPVIFASSILSIPQIIINLFGISTSGVGAKVVQALSQGYWFNPSYPWASLGLILYVLMVFFFAYFYTAITFNPMEIANNMKKSGGFVPGIRPGQPTQDYLNRILNYIIFIGACGLIVVAFIPMFFNGFFSTNMSFGGTSLIIVVGVVIETIKNIESRMLVRNYQGFLLD